jgi:adenylosuccinate lyase
MSVYPENMAANLIRTKGLIFSQRVLLALMDKGMPRMQAYDIVQRCAMRSWKEGSEFRANLLLDAGFSRYLGEKELDRIFDLNYYLRNVNKIFSRVFRG